MMVARAAGLAADATSLRQGNHAQRLHHHVMTFGIKRYFAGKARQKLV
jgi:hypothetical protein